MGKNKKTFYNDGKITFCCSTYNTLNYLKLAIKSVRQNAHFKDAPFVVHAENCDDGTNEWLEKVNHLPVEMLVGIGGNIRSLMKLLNKKKGYPVDKQELKNLLIELEKLSIEEKINQLGLAEDRADVIVPAGKIFLEILDKTSINSVCALEWSLSDAIAFDYYLNNIELFYDYKIA